MGYLVGKAAGLSGVKVGEKVANGTAVASKEGTADSGTSATHPVSNKAIPAAIRQPQLFNLRAIYPKNTTQLSVVNRTPHFPAMAPEKTRQIANPTN